MLQDFTLNLHAQKTKKQKTTKKPNTSKGNCIIIRDSLNVYFISFLLLTALKSSFINGIDAIHCWPYNI